MESDKQAIQFLRKVFLSIAAIFLIWQSYQLLTSIHRFESNSLLLIIFVAWLINIFITGIFAFSGFAFPTQKLMPESYYKIYQADNLKKLYNFLRVDVFRLFLLATFWKSEKQRQKYFNRKRDGINNLILQSKKSEFGHLIPFLLINFVAVYLVLIGLYKLALCTFIINIIGNFYPIILQRHHRMRIDRLRRRYA